MKIELKSVKFFEALSEETNAFTANVWVNGKKAGYAKNDGHGGCTFIRAYPEQRELFNEAENWLLEQPQINIGTKEQPYMVDSDMETKVDSLFEEWLDKKEQKKLQKNCEKGICYGNKNSYHIISWRNINIQQMLENPTGKARLQKVVSELVEKNENVLNENLPEEWLK